MTAAPRDIAALGAAIPLLRGLPSGVVSKLVGTASWIDATPGQLLLDFAEPSDDVFLLLSGSLRVVIRTAKGDEVILEDMRPGEILGELAALDGAPRSAAVTAIQRSRIVRVGAARFRAFLAETPEAALRVMQLLVARVRSLTTRVLELSQLDVRHRLYAELLRQAREGPGGERLISPPPTGQEVAARLGARREAVSRELAQMLRDGVLERRRGALILRNPGRLEAAITLALGA